MQTISNVSAVAFGISNFHVIIVLQGGLHMPLSMVQLITIQTSQVKSLSCYATRGAATEGGGGYGGYIPPNIFGSVGNFLFHSVKIAAVGKSIERVKTKKNKKKRKEKAL